MEDLSELCRVCLVVPDESQLLDLNIVYDEEEELSYSDCFRICTNIDLNLGGNEMPHNLCKTCGLELQMAYDFYKKVEESKRYLNTEKCNSRQATTELQITQRFLECDEIKTENIIIESIINTSSPSKSSATPIEATETDDDEVNEELLDDLEEYHSVERLDDEDAETIQSNYVEKVNGIEHDTITDVVDTDGGFDVARSDVFIIESLSSTCEDETELPTEKYRNTDMSWQQAVVAVANESHLPLEENNEKNFQGGEEIETSLLHEVHMKSIGEHDTVELSDDLELKPMRKRHTGKYSCNYCQKVFPNYSRMAMHRHTHEPDRPKYPCVDCGRIYATKQAMEVHVRTAHTKTGYACTICDKIYAIKKGLEIHMRYHTGDFPYVCHLCGKKFAQICHLNTHNNVKHNSVRFSCEHPNCGKFFTSSASLRNHEFSHGVMPFECEYCQRGYPAKSKLKVHIRRSHGKDMTLDELEHMRKFHVTRSKLNLVKVLKCED